MPYSSNDIAMQIAQQNQMFMQGAGMANQMGMAGGGMSPMFGQPGYSQSRNDPSSYSEMIGRGGTSATLGMLPSMPGMLGAAGGMGNLFGVKALSPLGVFDPLSMGIGGFKAGGLAGGIAGAGLSLGIGAAASYGAEQMYKGAVNYQRTGGILNQSYGGTFQQGNMETTGGQGFTAQQKKQMTTLMRQMEYVPELMTSSDELQRILLKMEQTGMMSGAVGITEIGRRFKDGIKTLRSLASIMGTTMEEALPLFQEARTSGFFSSQDIMRNAVNRQIVGGTMGFTQQQMSQVSASGAAMVSQMGGSGRSAGAVGAQQQLGQIGMARRLGLLTEEHVAAATGGQTGTQGAVALQQQFQQAGMQLAQSGMGRLVTAAAAEVGEGGKLTGRLDQGVLKQIQGGGIGRNELRRMAQENLRGRRGQYAMMEEELSSQMAASGPQSIIAMLRTAIDERGSWGEDLDQVVSHILKSYTNMSKPARDILIKLTKESGELMRKQEEHTSQQIEGMKVKELYRTRSLGYRWEQFKTEIGKYTTSPLKGAGESLSAGWESWGEDVNKWLTGVSVHQLSGVGVNDMRKGLATGASDLTNIGTELSSQVMVSGYGRSPSGLAEDLTAGAEAFGINIKALGANEAGILTKFDEGEGGKLGFSVDQMKQITSSKLTSNTRDLKSLAEAKGLAGSAKRDLKSLTKDIAQAARVGGDELAAMTLSEKLDYFKKRFGKRVRELGGNVTLGEVLRVAESEEGLVGMRGWTATDDIRMSLGTAGASGALRDTAEVKQDAVDAAAAMLRAGGQTGSELALSKKFLKAEAVGSGRLIQAAGKGELEALTKAAYRKESYSDLTDAEKAQFAKFGITAENYGQGSALVKGLDRVSQTEKVIKEEGGGIFAGMGESLYAPLLAGGLKRAGGKKGIGEDLIKAGQQEVSQATRKRMAEAAMDLTSGSQGAAGRGLAARGIELGGLEDLLRGGKGDESMDVAAGLMDKISGLRGKDRDEVMKALHGMGGAGAGLAAGAAVGSSLSRGRKTIAAMGQRSGLGEERIAELAESLGIESTDRKKTLTKDAADTLAEAIKKAIFSRGVTDKGSMAAFDPRTQYEQNFKEMLDGMKNGADAMSSFVSVVDRVIPNWKTRVQNMDKNRGAEDRLPEAFK